MGLRQPTHYSGLLPATRRAWSAHWPPCSIAAFHCIFYADVHDDHSSYGANQNKRKFSEDVARAFLCGDQPLRLSTLAQRTLILTQVD